MTEKIELLIGAEIAAKNHKKALSTISNKICHYGTFFKRLQEGKGVNFDTIARVKNDLINVYGVDWQEVERLAVKRLKQQQKDAQNGR